MESSSPVVLITGASSGIGLALARKLWNSEYRVVVTARKSSIRRISYPPFKETNRFLIRALDVTVSAEREALIAEIESLWQGVDILINNAGISYRSVVEHMSDGEEQEQMDVNFFGPMGLIRLVLPGMRKRGAGHIINVSSVGGMMAMPTMGSYSASKFALEGASEALWYEVQPWNIKVSLIQPGFIHSNSFRHVYVSDKAREAINGVGDYQEYYRSMNSFIEKLMGRAHATSESIADTIVNVMKDAYPPLRVPATFDASFFSLLRRFLPRRIYHWILYSNLPGVERWGKKKEK